MPIPTSRGILVRDNDRDSENVRRRKSRLQRLIDATRKNKDPDEGDIPIVRFRSITIREYPPIIGDNPECKTGPSLAIGWNPQSEVALSVDEYERHRPQRRTTNQLILSEWRRWEHFLSLGYAKAEIMAALKPVNIVRRQRRRTRHELQEGIFKKVWNYVSGGSSKRNDRKSKQKVELLEDSPPDRANQKTKTRSTKKSKKSARKSKSSAADETLSMGSDCDDYSWERDELLIAVLKESKQDFFVERHGVAFENGLCGSFSADYGWNGERFDL